MELSVRHFPYGKERKRGLFLRKEEFATERGICDGTRNLRRNEEFVTERVLKAERRFCDEKRIWQQGEEFVTEREFRGGERNL